MSQAASSRFISGIVKDKYSGEPLIGANIFCIENEKGCSSDVYGLFKLEIPCELPVQIQVSYVGYKQVIMSVEDKDEQQFDILLESGIDLGEINVKANNSAQQRTEMSALEIPVRLIKNLPLLGEHDVLKAIQLLPGIQSGSEGRNGLYVRGGSPDQNLFQIDGTPIYYVNHLGGFVSVFHPDILKNAKIYKGAFPARYGGRLSSVVDLRMKEGNKKEHHGSWGVGLISGDVSLEGPIMKDKTSYIVAFRRVWLDLFVRPITKISFKDYSVGYNFYDFFGKISHEHNANNRFYLSMYSGDDRLGSDYHFKEDKIKGGTDYIWGNILSTLRWNHIFSPRSSSDITFFYTRYRYTTKQFYSADEVKGNNTYYTGVHDLGIKADFNYHISSKYKISYGGGISGSWFKPGQISQYYTSGNTNRKAEIGKQNRAEALNMFAYIENEWRISDFLIINAGARISDYNFGQKSYIAMEPRVLGAINLKKLGSLKLSYSKMVQPVHLLSYSGNMFPTDIWLPSSLSVPPGNSAEFSVAYEKPLFNNKYEISIEAYYKKLTDLIEIKGGVPLINAQSWDQNIEVGGTGTSKGIEFLCKKTQGKTTGWISYTLAKSDRQFNNVNRGKTYPFKYDRRHDLAIVVSHSLSKRIDFSASWTLGSGYPITLYNGVHRAITQDTWKIEDPFQDNFDISGTTNLYPSKNWLRMSTYHRLDLGINFHKQKGSKIRTWTIGLYNAYNRQNAVSYTFKHRNGFVKEPIVLYQQSGFPIIPTVKYSVKF